MKKISTQIITLCLGLMSAPMFGQLTTPEVLYYKFDGSGTTVPNLATAPPAGTATATIMGSITQGSGGMCGGALIGSGNAASTDYLNTNWAPSIGTGSWTVSFYSKDITPSSTLFYIFGDANTSSFRCFTNGVAGANNWILRGPVTDVYINGGATVAPHVNTWVYDQAAGNIYAYLDGVLVSTVAQGAVNLTGTGPFKVMGYATNVGSPAGGKLDEFRFYSHALTASEVAALNYVFTSSTATVSSCNSYVSPAGNTYNFTGTYMDTIANSTGCDSIITTNLTILQPSSSTFAASACAMYTAPSGAMYMSSGTYMDTIPNAAGCDSIMTINVTINQPTTASFSPTACSMYTLPSGAMVMSSGTYMDTIPNSVGCDSIMTFNVTINMPTSATFSATTCGSYTMPSGAVAMSSGTYMDTIPNMAGCDSVMTFNLTINQPSNSSMAPVVCGSFTAPSGAVYTTSGVYFDTIPNMAGCDSIISIQLTVNNSTASSISVSECNSYTAPSGAVYTTSGTYIDMIPNMAGCDSVITIALTVTTVNAGATVSSATCTATGNISGATFQWIDCSNMSPIGGATSATYTATANGSYAVIITNNSCVDTSNCVTVTGIGIEENTFASAISIYPNPNSGNFTINIGDQYTDVVVTVTDLAGRVVFNQASNNTNVIPVQLDAAAGTYMVTVQSGENIATFRVVKNN